MKKGLAGLVTVIALFFASPAHSATIAVTSMVDANSGGATCTLRDAIKSMNNGANFAGCVSSGAAYGTSNSISVPGGTYTISKAGANELANATGSLDVLANVAIAGAGYGATIIDGGGAGIGDRVMFIGSGVTASVVSLQ